jgi:hypothetical protein
MKNSGKQNGFSSKSFLILLIFIGGIWLITHSIVSGEFLLKGNIIERYTVLFLDSHSVFHWCIIVCIETIFSLIKGRLMALIKAVQLLA